MGNGNGGGGGGAMIMLLVLGGACCLSVVCSGGVLLMYNTNKDFKASIDGLFGGGEPANAEAQWEKTKAELEEKCEDTGLYKPREEKNGTWVCPSDFPNDTGMNWSLKDGYFSSSNSDYNGNRQCSSKPECVKYVQHYASAYPNATTT